MRDLTDEEHTLLTTLGEAARLHSLLPYVHPSDAEEFTLAIHAAQNIVLARPATETTRKVIR